ncbi:MAG: CusA/CzcA family heavy metal efflux RND transporter [Planctomycetes bacterium]|nr:CusA/CzcA family heavy metal efflux RND transporter [Planctomycetota bacterium]
MIDALLRLVIQHRILVLIAALALGAAGSAALSRLPIDAVPDITPNQVQVNVVVPALAPLDVERQVTYPVETALAGIPGLSFTRSLSRNGFSQVTAVFDDHADLYFSRQQVAERLADVKPQLPSGAEPVLGPVSTGLGEVYFYTLEFTHENGAGATVADGRPGWQSDGAYLSVEGERLTTEEQRLTYLRTIQDWVLVPQLRGVPGVAGIDSNGGYQKQYLVWPDPARVAAYGLTFRDVTDAIGRNNRSVGAGTVRHNGEAYVVRAEGRVHTLADLSSILLANHDGTSIHLRDVAEVGLGHELRTGSASRNGRETVLGIALMLIGGNSRTVAAGVDERLADLASQLPADVRAIPLLNRSTLVDATIHTVERNLCEGAILVIAVLFLLLGNLRGALVAALVIPLSMCCAALGMTRFGISGNLMSLGALDFGIIVDSAILLVENCVRQLGRHQQELGRPLVRQERIQTTYRAARDMVGPTVFGQIIIITVYLPILMLSGVEGKMFSPMAATVVLALIGSLILTLTLAPALVAMTMVGRIAENENALMRLASRAYRPVLAGSLRWRWFVVGGSLVLAVVAILLFGRLGREFIPRLDEGNIDVQTARMTSIDLAQSTEMQKDMEAALIAMPEVSAVVSKTGTAEAATDPMPVSNADTFITLKPHGQWPDPSMTKQALITKIDHVLDEIPGTNVAITQPIEDRFNELIAGVRADVAVKVFGDRFEDLIPMAEAVASHLRAVPGAADVRVEQIQGSPAQNIEIDHTACSRLGIDVGTVQDAVATAIGGEATGVVFENDRRFDIVVRLKDTLRNDDLTLRMLPIPLPRHEGKPDPRSHDASFLPSSQSSVPLSSLARIEVQDGYDQVSRENGKRRVVVQCNVRGRDLGSFVAEARKTIAAHVPPRPGTWLVWGGQFENLQAARARLMIVVPVCLVMIFLLLFTWFNSGKYAALVFTGVPLALTGGVFALIVAGLPFSISAAVGFIALSGVAVLNGLVVVSYINHLRRGGMPVEQAITEGSLTKLRPMLMTALVGALGYVPMAIAHGQGSEVQKPLAVVVIGGIITSAVLTLLVLPALYRLWHRKDSALSDRWGAPRTSAGSDGSAR